MPNTASGNESAANATASARQEAAAADFEAQIRVLREEVARLTKEIQNSGERSMSAMRKAAAAGAEHLKAQGEEAWSGIRGKTDDLEGQLTVAVREKPMTAMALAAGVGFLLAVIARR